MLQDEEMVGTPSASLIGGHGLGDRLKLNHRSCGVVMVRSDQENLFAITIASAKAGNEKSVELIRAFMQGFLEGDKMPPHILIRMAEWLLEHNRDDEHGMRVEEISETFARDMKIELERDINPEGL